VWAHALTPDAQVRRDAYVTELTGLLTLADGWPKDMRVMARTEPLHVYDQVHAKLAVGYEPLGERRPKNLAREVSVYRLVLDEPPPAGAGPGCTLAPAAADAGLRGRVIGHAQRLGILWAALAAVNLFTSDDFWAIWPGIVIVVFLGLEAAPLLARGWLDAPLARLAVIVAGLALVNLASRSGEPWFLWPAGVLVIAYLLRRAWRRVG
jgi:hypothetical protein